MAGPAYTVREATIEDCEAMMGLIRELAEYERAPHEVTVSIEEMREQGFGPRRIWGAFVAELPAGALPAKYVESHPEAAAAAARSAAAPVVVGMALYYYRYSTWKGRTLYLEDFVVSEACRGTGIGRALFDRVRRFGQDEGCHAMIWQVLEWNEPAIKFYKQQAADLDGEWINCKISFDKK